MKKTLLPVLLILAIALSACGEAKAAEPTPEPTSAPAEEVPTAAVPTETAAGGEQAAEIPAVTDETNPCVPKDILDLILAEPYPGLPEVTDEDYIVGPKDAPVTFMVYSDPQCPYCEMFDPLIEEITAIYPKDVRFVYRFFPLTSIHDKALLASQAMVAAGLQGKFDEFRIWIYAHQQKNPNNPDTANLSDSEFWYEVKPDQFDDWLVERVDDLGLNPDQLIKDMFSDSVINKVRDAQSKANDIGIGGTPTLFLNGYPWPDGEQRTSDSFSIYTKLLLNRNIQYKTCPEMTVDRAKTYTATITTTQGDVVVDLFADKAPYAVNSFIYLAKTGWYNGLPLINTDQFILTGDPTDTYNGGAGFFHKDEFNDGLDLTEPGMLANYPIRGVAGSNSSNLIINKSPLPDWVGLTVFGKVTSGLDVLDKLALRDNPTSPVVDKVLSITITEK